jgi:hypothetical protein
MRHNDALARGMCGWTTLALGRDHVCQQPAGHFPATPHDNWDAAPPYSADELARLRAQLASPFHEGWFGVAQRLLATLDARRVDF